VSLLVDVRGLTYRHADGTLALDELNLQVRDNESLVLFGPNGSGKTTLLLHLNGTLRGIGTIRVAGVDLTANNLPEIRRRVGLVFQNADEQLFMPSVLEDVLFGPRNLGKPEAEAQQLAIKVLHQVGIATNLFDRPPFHLSAGEKRRVALAGVLVMEPDLLLLDEPTTSLDPPGQRALLHLLRSLPQPKIIATHDPHFARALCNRAVFLSAGKILADASVDEVVRQFDWTSSY
jgi:cobalt/nickel transport system ATP-binding protein